MHRDQKNKGDLPFMATSFIRKKGASFLTSESEKGTEKGGGGGGKGWKRKKAVFFVFRPVWT